MDRHCPESDPLPKSDPIIDFCCLLLAYQWDRCELEKAGVKEKEFRLIVARLREELIAVGYIEEGDF